MRTTLTLEEDVAALLREVREKRKANLKQIVNEALREGLTRMRAPRKRSSSYRAKPASLGGCLLSGLDDVSEALAVSEGEAFR